MLKVDVITRSNSVNIAAVLAFLLLLLMHFSSTGFVRGGDDDEGSGIGGTGRMATPGSESGFGGTGFKPFVGMNDNAEIEILHTPARREQAVSENLALEIPATIPVDAGPLQNPVAVLDEASLTRDSSAIDIREQIQRSLDVNAVYLQRQQQAAQSIAGSNFDSGETIVPVESRTTDPAAVIASVDPAEIAAELALEQAAAAAETLAEAQDQLTWERVASYLSSQEPTAGDFESSQLAATDTEEQELERLSRPERIQRPQLPPIQRVRPIQRASILPPRIKPLRL